MGWYLPLGAAAPAAPGTSFTPSSLYDILMGGGPIMIPIGLCSVVALTVVVERWIRLRPDRLGTASFGKVLLATAHDEGPARALKLCEEKPTPLARILGAGFKRWGLPTAEMEKAVEDAGAREVKRLSNTLRPLIVVATIAPLLGLLGTVWGIILAFANVGYQQGVGKPELLAYGISQALVTTAAGLVIAIPTQAAYFYYRSRLDRFIKLTEDLCVEVLEGLSLRGGAHADSRV